MGTLTRISYGTENGITASSRDFFFDGDAGDNANAGTAAAPWLNLRNLNGTVNELDEIQPGDRFLFKAGTTCVHAANYFVGAFEGTEAAPIVFGAYEGTAYTASPTTNPVIIRNSKTDRNATLVQSTAYPELYYHIFTGGPPEWAAGDGHVWEGDGTDMTLLANTTDINDLLAAGSYDGTYHVWQGALDAADDAGTPDGVYYKPTSGGALGAEVVWISDGAWGGSVLAPQTVSGGDTPIWVVLENIDTKYSLNQFYISDAGGTIKHNQIVIRNCNVSHCPAAAWQFIGGNGLSDITIDSCTASYVAAGVQFDIYNSQAYTVENCVVKDCDIGYYNWYNSMLNYTINKGGSSYDSEGIGVQNAQNCSFHDNYIHHCGMPKGVGTPTNAGNVAFSFWNINSSASCVPNNNSVYSNLVYLTEFGCTGIHNGYYSVDSTYNKVYSNIFIGCSAMGIKVYAQGSTNEFVNNTLIDCETGFWLGKNTGTGGSIVKRNLIISSGEYYMSSSEAAEVAHDCDYNAYYGGAATPFGISESAAAYPFYGTSQVSLATWKGYTGSPDANSKTKNPWLVSNTATEAAHCYPRSNSTLLTDGDVTPTAVDYFGNTPVSAYVGAVSTLYSGDVAGGGKLKKTWTGRR